MRGSILGFDRSDTSFGEASSRTQATDPNRRETLRIRTPLPGLRGEAKWLAVGKPIAIRRGVPKLLRERCGQGFPSTWRVFPQGVTRCGLAPLCVATEGRHAMDSDSPGRSW